MASSTSPSLSLVGADGRVIATRLDVAYSFLARFRGLMGVPRLGDSEGLLLPRTNSIHMLFMRFPIDCLFLGSPTANGSQEVVELRRALPPWRGVVWWARGAKDVVELPAGTIDASGVDVGDSVRIEVRASTY